jgi:hypothetical protein
LLASRGDVLGNPVPLVEFVRHKLNLGAQIEMIEVIIFDVLA